MSVAIAIEIGSPDSTLERVSTTISSIMRNIGVSDYKIIIAMAPHIDKSIKDYVYALKENNKKILDLMPEENYFWADFINQAIDRSGDCKYFIKSHDDIELLTPDFLPITEKTIRNIKEPVGWVSFTDKDYLNGHFAPSTRPGFYEDYLFEKSWERKKIFQFHSLPDNWWRPPLFQWDFYLVERYARYRLHLNPPSLPVRSKEYYANLPYDLPKGPVKCHAPFNHFVLIEMDKLKTIGKCENWRTLNALMVDEDWGLRALQSGLSNLWIPDLAYVHYRPYGGTRSWTQITKEKDRVDKLFFEKWGFHSSGRVEELDFITTEYKNTNIPWSIGRKSYDWDYIQ